ncbi:protein phosphatase Slingshot homolog 2 isoform X2 [Chiloscyllium plagiosum]|uniref:protein phosphatase Slingshot homolog 2 isoform X2 n=1 Tax=Chiloscyllium plagiosum TaxID=36176 RepID=UPI001CB87666|nr:protein phosphatase Slingshot homolog 2 isoform X2 [Chiloscyllium plagiosum]
MTLDAILSEGKAEVGSWCSCCCVKMTPYFSENAVISQNEINLLINESFLTVKGAALFLPRGNGSTAPRINHQRNKHAGDLQQHLQAMFTLLRPEDNIRLAVRLESAYLELTRYMVVVSTNGRQDTEESIVLGMDFFKDSTCTMGLVLPLWSDTLIHLDGDGGFSVSTVNRIHIFKPVSVQAMWSALQSLHKACEIARTHNYYPGSLYLTWISYYESRINSNQAFINEWNAMQDVQSHRSDSPVLFTDVPTERERTERLIKTKLREVMMQMDLENVTSKEIRTELEMQMVCNLREFKEYIDNEMIVILRQMDNPTEIFEHVYLGSEWNASNLEDLQSRGIRYILNITREIDNFFPGMFEYHNIRVYDEEATDLLAYWNDTYKFISKAKKNGSKCLVHCKMGISRSASTVIAYAMKEYGWNLEKAYSYVKEKRTVTKPNVSFMRQLEEYQGILLASKQRHNKLWRSHSDSDLSDHRERISKSTVDLNRRDSTSTTEMPTDLLTEHLCQSQFSNVLESSLSGVQEGKNELDFGIDTEYEISLKHNPDELNTNISSAALSGLEVTDSITTRLLAGSSSDILPLQDSQSDKSPEVLSQNGLSPSPNHSMVLTDLEAGESEKDVNLKPNNISVPLLETAPLPEDRKASPELTCSVSPSNVNAEICSLSTDRIDFFSAREKFIELSQENGARAQSHLKTEEFGGGKYCATKVAAQETLEKEQIANGQGDTSLDNPAHIKDKCVDDDVKSNKENLVPKLFHKKSSLTRSQSLNVISVKEIVTGIESNQSSGVCQSKMESVANNQIQTPKRNTVHELPADFHWLSESNTTAKKLCKNDSLVAESDSQNVTDLSEAKDDVCHDMHLTAKTYEECQETVIKESAQDGRIHPKQVPKWCPGSVKRATQEFEERLKQGQEHQSLVTLPIRKNSRIDGAVASEFVVTNKSEAIVPELSLFKGKRKESTDDDPNLLLELSVSQNQELVSDLQSQIIEHPLESRLELEQAEPGSLSTLELEKIHSKELDSYTQLPKKVEIIEYTHVFKPPSQEDSDICSTGEENIVEVESLGKENMATVQSADDLKNIEVKTTEFPCQSPLLSSLDTESLTETDNKEVEEMTFESGSPPGDAVDSFSDYEIALFVSGATHLPLKGLENQTHVLHLEGITESSTDTDAEILDKEYSGLQEVDTKIASLKRDDGCITLSHEDLKLSFSRFDESVREMQEMSRFEKCTRDLSHSSSNDSTGYPSCTLGMSKQQSKEIEAKIRQAGLTTPSQIKRSASIAKLGYLELSRNDLFKKGLDSSKTYQAFLDSIQRTPWTAQSTSEYRTECAVKDEPSKKKCVSISLFQDPQSTVCFAEQLKASESIAQSKPVGKPLIQYAKAVESTQECPLASTEENLPQIKSSFRYDTDAPCPTPLMAVAPRQYHHRNHSLKRLKVVNDRKRTTNPLYNTM